MIKNLLFLVLGLLCFPVMAQQRDMLLDSSFVGNKGWRIKYSDKMTALVLETSADKGKTWHVLDHKIYGLDSTKRDQLLGMYPSGIHFIDDSTGFAFGSYPIFLSSYFILRTSDAGRTWHLADDWTQLNKERKSLDKLSVRIGDKFIHFRDSINGIKFLGYIDNDLVFLETKDKGRTWNNFKIQTGLPERYYLSAMTFTDPMKGEFELNQPGNLLSYKLATTDGGKTWLLTSAQPVDASAHQGRTLDSSSLSNGSLFKLVVDSTREGWSVLYSGDNGKTWSKRKHKIISAQKRSFFPVYSARNVSIVNAAKIHFVNDSLGFILCTYGFYTIDYVLLQTSDGGKIWKVIDHYPTNIVKKDKNFHFDMYMRKLVHFSDAMNGMIYIGSSEGSLAFLRTNDGGSSWAYFTVPAEGLAPNSMVFSDPMHGEIILYNMNVKSEKKLVTKDGGKTWRMK